MTAPIYLEATETDPNLAARHLWGDRGRALYEELAAKVGLVTGLSLPPSQRAESRERLVDFVSGPLARYLTATDRAIYAAAASAAETRLLVCALREQHRLLTDEIERLRRADDFDMFAAAAHTLVVMLCTCRCIEQQVLAPALIHLPGLNFAEMIIDLDTILAGGRLRTPATVDIRDIPLEQRHPRIFAAFSRLDPGGSFELINHHDPKHLRREFDATHPGNYHWDYLETGPQRWRIRIGRTSATGTEHCGDLPDE